MSPAFAQTLADAEAIFVTQRMKLKENLDYLFGMLGPQAPVYFEKNYPLVYPTHQGVYQALYDQQILITHFAYAGGALNRIVVAAHHKQEDLARLAYLCNYL